MSNIYIRYYYIEASSALFIVTRRHGKSYFPAVTRLKVSKKILIVIMNGTFESNIDPHLFLEFEGQFFQTPCKTTFVLQVHVAFAFRRKVLSIKVALALYCKAI